MHASLASRFRSSTVHPNDALPLVRLPQTLVGGSFVDMVTVPGSTGVFGILKDHVPTVAQLSPGVVAVSNNDTVDK